MYTRKCRFQIPLRALPKLILPLNKNVYIVFAKKNMAIGT